MNHGRYALNQIYLDFEDTASEGRYALNHGRYALNHGRYVLNHGILLNGGTHNHTGERDINCVQCLAGGIRQDTNRSLLAFPCS